MNSLSIKKGDNVLVIAGKEKGKTGQIGSVNPTKQQVTVEGVNLVSKHKKPRNAQDKGGIIKQEGNIHVSNVQIVCASCGKATRIAHSIVEGKKVRTCKKCGAQLDAPKKVAKKTAKTAPKKAVEKK